MTGLDDAFAEDFAGAGVGLDAAFAAEAPFTFGEATGAAAFAAGFLDDIAALIAGWVAAFFALGAGFALAAVGDAVFGAVLAVETVLALAFAVAGVVVLVSGVAEAFVTLGVATGLDAAFFDTVFVTDVVSAFEGAAGLAADWAAGFAAPAALGLFAGFVRLPGAAVVTFPVGFLDAGAAFAVLSAAVCAIVFLVFVTGLVSLATLTSQLAF